MSDIAPPVAAPEGPAIRILAQYIKDLSFENPNAPDALRGGAPQPQVDLGVELNARGRPDGFFEVELKLTARAMREADVAFHIELLYAGLFQIIGIDEAALEPVLMIECPRFLFPSARRIIGDLTGEGGYPPFVLEPIDFGAIYQSRQGAGVNAPAAGEA